MSISFPKTWAAEERLDAADLQGNLDAMLSKHHKLSGTDVANSDWLDTNHIVKPDYNPYTNVVEAVSGVYGGMNSGGFFNKISYMTRWKSGSVGSVRNAIPHTTFTVDIRRPASIFYQWWACALSETDSNGSTDNSTAFVYFNNPNVPIGISNKHPEQPNASTHSALFDGDIHSNGFGLLQLSGEVFQYGIGMTGQSEVGRTRFISWGVSLEVFYL